MFCQHCGNQLAEGAAFCGQCGAKVAVQPAYEAPQQPAYEAPQQPAYEAPQQPAYEAPQQPAYEAPQQPAYEAPQQPAYTAPQQPAYEAPQQPAYTAPQQPAYEAPQQPAYTAPQSTYQQPVQPVPTRNTSDAELSSLATNTMIFGIVSLASGLAAGVPGIVFSVLTKNKAAEFITRAGSLYGKAKVGANLAKAGLPVGIVMTVFYFICFIAGIVG